MQKKLTIDALIARNKHRPGPKQVVFPFLVVEPWSADKTDLVIRVQNNLKRISFSSNREMMIYGDLEAIAMMNIADANDVQVSDNTSMV